MVHKNLQQKINYFQISKLFLPKILELVPSLMQ